MISGNNNTVSNQTDTMLKKSLFVVFFFLAGILQTIVCSTDEQLTIRRDLSSSHVDLSGYISDNLNNLNDSKSNEQKSNKKQSSKQPQPDQPATLQQSETNGRAFVNSNLNETIHSIFHLGPEMGLTLFNTTLTFFISFIDQTITDESFPDSQSPNILEESLHVKERPTVKPKLVSNEFLYLQKPTQPPPLTITGNKDFLFPDQVYVDMEPKCAEKLSDGKPFCTKVRNYPALDHLESLLKEEFSKFDVYFSEDLAQPVNITQRMNSEPDEEYLCSSVEKVIYPEAAMTRDSNWLLIVNNHENYKQGVRIEECLNEGETCNIVQFPNHYTATCKQNFIYRSLVAITPNGTITKDHFKMPSCCKCVLRQVH